ncbi:MAG TPA: hypothetical protein VFO77_06085, partial [Actinoplanes sp.]|nr:hypothetical protein [Actinoplanes sp.]
TLDKLLAEAAAGRVVIWVRWGAGRFATPPEPVHRIGLVVTRHAAATGSGRLHSRRPDGDRPPPVHSVMPGGQIDARELPMFGPDGR